MSLKTQIYKNAASPQIMKALSDTLTVEAVIVIYAWRFSSFQLFKWLNLQADASEALSAQQLSPAEEAFTSFTGVHGRLMSDNVLWQMKLKNQHSNLVQKTTRVSMTPAMQGFSLFKTQWTDYLCVHSRKRHI